MDKYFLISTYNFLERSFRNYIITGYENYTKEECLNDFCLQHGIEGISIINVFEISKAVYEKYNTK